MTLVEVLVATAIMLIIFLGFFEAYKTAAEVTSSAAIKTAAAAVLTDRLEYIRSLSYDAVGTVGGTPSGTIPQTQIKLLNSITYTVHTTVGYVDDAADGSGAGDSNALTHDYKSVKIEVDWSVNGIPQSISAVTTVAPVGLETSFIFDVCAG